jgi:hypothetical protein
MASYWRFCRSRCSDIPCCVGEWPSASSLSYTACFTIIHCQGPAPVTYQLQGRGVVLHKEINSRPLAQGLIIGKLRLLCVSKVLGSSEPFGCPLSGATPVWLTRWAYRSNQISVALSISGMITVGEVLKVHWGQSLKVHFLEVASLHLLLSHQLVLIPEANEGQQIISYLAKQLRVSDSEKDKMLRDFTMRCAEWMRDSVDTQRNVRQ